MLSASSRKSVTDLWRRRARAVFSVLTLALAVASVFFFAVPTLIDRTMQREVDEGRLADVTLAIRPVALDDAQLATLAEVPNVAAVEARTSAEIRVLVGERRAAARLIGVRDLAHQEVDVVRLASGELPGPGMVLADVQDANVGLYDGDAGDVLTLLDDDGSRREVTIAGRARSLPGGEQVQDDSVIVLYAPASTVAAVSGQPGYDELMFRLDDPSPAAAEATVADLRRHLDTLPGFAGLSNLPAVRAPGDWPGRSDTETFSQLLGVITVLALLSAVVLISSTMTTLVSDQTREIGVMRALGARRRQIAAIYLRTTLLLGALGAVAGAVLGVALSSLLARYFGTEFWAVTVAPGVDVTVLLVGLVVGLVTPSLAALPAIRRAVHVDLREALAATGSALGDQDVLDRVLRRAGALPRVVQIGLRNVGRRKRRSLATAAIVALAVGNLLAVLALADAATRSSRDSWGNHLEDIQVSTGGRLPFDAPAEAAIRATPGVAEAEPVLKNTIELRGREAFLWGVEQDPLFRYHLAAGRWFDPAEAAGAEPVTVIERNIAQNLGIELGDRVTVTTVVGDAELTVIGVATNQQEDGTALYVPLATARALVGLSTGARSYWIRADSREPASIDRVANLIEDRLTATGHEVSTEITYVGERDEVAANRTLTTSIAVLGFVIVAMSMVGLANAVTTNVIERTREIGVLRSIGARARHIRWIFGTEGVAVALAGWLMGIPLGYALDRLIVRLIWEIVDVRVPVVFPARNIPIALAGTVLLALVVLGLPVRRATRLRPGDALRYT